MTHLDALRKVRASLHQLSEDQQALLDYLDVRETLDQRGRVHAKNSATLTKRRLENIIYFIDQHAHDHDH